MPRAQEHQSDARERLLAAAQALYAENGVAATTPRSVLQRSGVGQGSLYHHFPSKKELAQAAVGRTVRDQLVTAEQLLSREAPARERIGAYLLRDRDAVAGCRVGRLTTDPLVMTEAPLRELVEGYFSELMAVIRDVLLETGMESETAEDRAATIVAVVQGGYVLARATGDPEVMRRAVRGLFAMLEEDGDE